MVLIDEQQSDPILIPLLPFGVRNPQRIFIIKNALL